MVINIKVFFKNFGTISCIAWELIRHKTDFHTLRATSPGCWEDEQMVFQCHTFVWAQQTMPFFPSLFGLNYGQGLLFFFLSILAACDQKPFHSWEEVLLLGEQVWSDNTGSPAFVNKPRLGFLNKLSECCGVLWKNPDHTKSSDMASTWTLDSVWTNWRMKSFKL